MGELVGAMNEVLWAATPEKCLAMEVSIPSLSADISGAIPLTLVKRTMPSRRIVWREAMTGRILIVKLCGSGPFSSVVMEELPDVVLRGDRSVKKHS